MVIVTALCLALFLVKSIVDFFSLPSPLRSFVIATIARFVPAMLLVVIATLASPRRRVLMLFFTSAGALVGFLFLPYGFTFAGHRLPTLWNEFQDEFTMLGLLPMVGALIGFMIGFGFGGKSLGSGKKPEKAWGRE